MDPSLKSERVILAPYPASLLHPRYEVVSPVTNVWPGSCNYAFRRTGMKKGEGTGNNNLPEDENRLYLDEVGRCMLRDILERVSERQSGNEKLGQRGVETYHTRSAMPLL